MKIAKKQGVNTYTKYPAPNWVKFAFKYFSKSTEKENMKPSNTISWILASLFLVGFFGSVINFNWLTILIITLTYTTLLFSLVIFLFSAVIVNNKRIKKITRELGCSLQEWNDFVKKYKEDLK